MSSSGVNYWAVLVGGGVYFLLVALWYSKGLFGKVWMQGIGKTEEQIKAAFKPWKLVWSFIGSFFAAYGIARLMSWTSGITLRHGIKIGLLAGVCFILAPMTINDAMEGRPMKLTVINVLYHMGGLILIGFILGAWR